MALIGRNLFIGSDEEIFIGTDGYDKTTEPTFVGFITASDGAADDKFGTSVAVGNNRIVVGAFSKDIDSNANQGSVYIFDLNGNQLGIITASDGLADDEFGSRVAVGNNKIVVGAYDVESVYIYDLDGTNENKLMPQNNPSTDRFGYSVAVGSGRIVVGQPAKTIGSNNFQGRAFIYDLDGNEVGIITASDGVAFDQFGQSVAVGSGRIVVGVFGRDRGSDYDVGAAYIYDLDGNEVGIITASDGAQPASFGWSVAVGSGRIVVGAYRDDSEQGAAYIYDLDGNNENKITASDGSSQTNPQFGNSVSVGSGRIVVGASLNDDNGTNSGAAYIYDLDGNQIGILTASDDGANEFPGNYFGNSVAVGSGRIVVGSILDNINGNTDQGSVYIYNTPEADYILDVLDK